MKSIAIFGMVAMMSSVALSQPNPKKENHEKAESKKEYKIAQKKAKKNEQRYKHEARERRHFNGM